MVFDELLYELFADADANSLWCVDESSASLLNLQFKGHIITNRADLYQQLQAQKRSASFNDFDFSAYPDNSISQAFYRIAKDKKLNLHIVHSIAAKLKSDGFLVLMGYKNEGIESLCKIIEMSTDAPVKRHKLKKQLQMLQIGKARQLRLENDYALLHRMEQDQHVYWSKPGIFGWEKTDLGSEILMREFSQLPLKAEQSILDLGCGYGYLSMQAYHAGYKQIDATDNNAAAVAACSANFGHLGIEGEVIADDCGKNIQKRYDIILCNPPFHQGFDHSKPLTNRFCEAASRLLKPKGKAYFVVNQFIGIEKAAAGLFSKQEALLQEQGFKILCLSK